MVHHTHDIVRRERHTLHMLFAFALAVIAATLTWFACARYI
jgi:hypothetical protein